jgi:O-antigen ligase
MALWTLFIAGVLACRVNKGGLARLLLWAALAVGIVATIISAQRSAVWIVVPGLLWLGIQAGSRSRLLRLVVLCGAIVAFVFAFSIATERGDSLERLTQVEGGAQAERETTWRRAARMIEEDPIFGSAFRVIPGERGIHNGFLAGWARFGLGWLVLFLASLMLITRFVLKSRAIGTAKIAAGLILLEIVGHGSTHTNVISLGDIVGWCYLGFAVVFVSTTYHAQSDLLRATSTPEPPTAKLS